MLGVFTLAAGVLGAPFSPAPVPPPAAPRITPPTSALIRLYSSAAAIVVRTSDAQIGPTLG